MKNFKILVPMDFSNCAVGALRIAKNIAKQLNAKLELVTAVHLPHIHSETMGLGLITQPILTEQFKQVDKNYKELYEKESLHEVDFQIKKYSCTVENAVFSSIEKGDIDLVITGTQEHHDIMEKLFGSRSSEMISLSKNVPILVVPEQVKDFDIHKIGFAIDYEKEILTDKMEILKLFASLFNASIDVLFVSNVKNSKQFYSDQRSMISDFFGEIKHQFIDMYSDDKSTDHDLLKAVEELKLDMLYMQPKNRKFPWGIFNPSMTKKISMKISTPLLTTHE